jgi:hypothetical protein
MMAWVFFWCLAALVACGLVLDVKVKSGDGIPPRVDVVDAAEVVVEEVPWDPFADGPWRPMPGVVLVDTRLLTSATEPSEYQRAASASDRDRVVLLEEGIAADGLRVPLQVNLDQRGRLRLADGHHRLVVANRMGAEGVPVAFNEVEHIRGWSVAAAPFLLSLVMDS